MSEERRTTSPVPPLGEVLEFMRLIWALDHALHRTSKVMETELGITGPQRLVLRIVGRFPGIPAGDLAEILHVHPSTLTGILKRLKDKGLLARRSDPRDGRRALLGLTAKGRKLDTETEGTVEAAVQETFSRLPAETIQSAANVLRTLARTFEGQVSPFRVLPPSRSARTATSARSRAAPEIE